jgi:hypothetical protein
MTDQAYSILQYRTWVEVNTDPQRRCYNGCHAKSKMQWTAWTDLETHFTAIVAKRLKFWEELNEYAVKSRGKVNTLQEFRVVPVPAQTELKHA